MQNKKDVAVLFGTGSIGQAIIRRIGVGRHIVLADYKIDNAKSDILSVVEGSQKWGNIKNLVNAAGVSSSQASVEEILNVDIMGTSILLEEFDYVMSNGGSGIGGGTTASYWYGDLQYLKATH